MDNNKNLTTKIGNENSLAVEETTFFLSMGDLNILQNIFIQLVNGYKYPMYEKEIKEAFTLLLNFPLSCKLFSTVSKQPLFPSILMDVNINLNYKKYLKLLFIKQRIQIDPYYKEKDINNIFYESCYFGYHDLINTLIDHGANINCRLTNKCIPLIEAVNQKNNKTVNKLLKFEDLNINKQDGAGKTALIHACAFEEQEDTIKILLSRQDVDINVKDGFGHTASEYAKLQGHQNTFQLLHNYEKLTPNASQK